MTPAVVGIEIPAAALSRRMPFVVVHVALGPLALVLGVVLPRSGHLALRLPQSITGGPAVSASPELLAELEALALKAVRADRAACRHLDTHRRNRLEYEAPV